MIVILYPAGAFGTTIEYCLKHFSIEHGPLAKTDPISTGSMHNYQKEFHIHHVDHIDPNFRNNRNIGLGNLRSINIINSIYPLMCSLNQTADVTIKGSFNAHKTYTLDNSVILIKFNDIRDMELSYLMRHEKIPLASLISSIKVESCIPWKQDATSVLDLERWQLRELLSIQFNDSMQDLLTVDQFAEDHWLILGFNDVLEDLPGTINTCINYVGWSRNDVDLQNFSDNWREKQEKIVSRLENINSIVDSTLSAKSLKWNDLELIDQVLIQAKLLRQGYEIKCDGLNSFPTNSTDLKKLLIKT